LLTIAQHARERPHSRTYGWYVLTKSLLAPIVMMVVAASTSPVMASPSEPNASTQQTTDDQQCNNPFTHHGSPLSGRTLLT
jgi:hypothetical protein